MITLLPWRACSAMAAWWAQGLVTPATRAVAGVPGCRSRQQTIAVWNDSFSRCPPKPSRLRTWKPMVLLVGPGTTSTVAGSNGTAVFTEPRVATVAHEVTAWLVATVYRPVMRRRPWNRPGRCAGPALSTQTPRTRTLSYVAGSVPIVGRSAERAVLSAAYARAAAGEPQVVLITGAAGIG